MTLLSVVESSTTSKSTSYNKDFNTVEQEDEYNLLQAFKKLHKISLISVYKEDNLKSIVELSQ